MTSHRQMLRPGVSSLKWIDLLLEKPYCVGYNEYDNNKMEGRFC